MAMSVNAARNAWRAIKDISRCSGMENVTYNPSITRWVVVVVRDNKKNTPYMLAGYFLLAILSAIL